MHIHKYHGLSICIALKSIFKFHQKLESCLLISYILSLMYMKVTQILLAGKISFHEF